MSLDQQYALRCALVALKYHYMSTMQWDKYHAMSMRVSMFTYDYSGVERRAYGKGR